MFLSTILIPVVSMLVLDYIWIGLVMKEKYIGMFSKVQCKKVEMRLTGAIWAYVSMILAFFLFVVPQIKNSKESIAICAFKYGFMFGILAYGIYNGTNYTLFKDYSLSIAVLDTLWGGLLYAALTCIYLMVLF